MYFKWWHCFLHQLNAFLGQFYGAGGAVACAGLLLAGVVRGGAAPTQPAAGTGAF